MPPTQLDIDMLERARRLTVCVCVCVRRLRYTVSQTMQGELPKERQLCDGFEIHCIRCEVTTQTVTSLSCEDAAASIDIGSIITTVDTVILIW